MSSSDRGRDVHSFDVHAALPLPTMALPAHQGVLKYGSGEAVVAHDMAEPHKRHLLTAARGGFFGPTRETPFLLQCQETLNMDHPSFLTPFAGGLRWS